MIVLLQVLPVQGKGQLLKLAVVVVCLIHFNMADFGLLFKYFTPEAGCFQTVHFLLSVHHVSRILAGLGPVLEFVCNDVARGG